MKKFLTILLSFMLINIQVYANCSDKAAALKKGQPAPCDGIFLGKKKAQEQKKKLEEGKITLEKLRVQTKLSDLYKKDAKDTEEIVDKERQKAEIWRKSAEDSTKKLIKSEAGRGTRDWMFFALGLLTTAAAGLAVGKLAK